MVTIFFFPRALRFPLDRVLSGPGGCIIRFMMPGFFFLHLNLGSVCIHISYNTIWFLWHFPLDSSLSWHFLVILICLLTFGMHGWYKFWGFLQVFACWRHCRVGLLAGWWHCSFWNFCPHIRADKSCKTNCLHNSWRHPVASHIPRKGLSLNKWSKASGTSASHLHTPWAHKCSTGSSVRCILVDQIRWPGETHGVVSLANSSRSLEGPTLTNRLSDWAILGWWSDTLWTCIYIYIWIY